MRWDELAPKRYREVFFAAHGFGPYACHFCDELVEFERVLVHHLDHDRSNNAPANLAAAHGPCHTSHHSRGRVPSAQQRRRNSDAHRGRSTSDETRALIAAGQARAHAEGRAATSLVDFNQRRETCVCGLETNVAGLRRHHRSGRGRECVVPFHEERTSRWPS